MRPHRNSVSFERDYGDVEGTTYSPIRRARRAAFLSGDDGPGSSIRAVRAANQSVGTFRQGDNYYVNDGGTLTEVTKEAFGKANTAGLSAEELKNARVGQIKETLVPVAESGVFEKPNADMPSLGATQQQSPIDMSPGQSAEFEINNNPPISSPSRADMKMNYFAAGKDDDED